MPYISHQASMINGADNGGGGMKKAGLVYRNDFRRVNQNYLKKKISENRLLGELDHPEKFDVSLSKVSHLIEDVKYDAKKRQIVGRIKLLVF